MHGTFEQQLREHYRAARNRLYGGGIKKIAPEPPPADKTARPLPEEKLYTRAKVVRLHDEPQIEFSSDPPRKEFIIPRRPKIRHIMRLVAKAFNTTELDMVAHRQLARIARPRHVVMYLCRHHTTRSLVEIGRNLGGRDHSTVISGVRKIERERKIDPVLDEAISAIEATLRNWSGYSAEGEAARKLQAANDLPLFSGDAA